MAIPMNFLFYDLETSGLSKSYDPMFQFAAVRCDENLNQLEVPTNLFCKPRNEVFPSPEAILANQLDVKMQP
jgi:exodeoxyribonuclease-1